MSTQALLCRLINPPIIRVLRSPLHALRSRNTTLIAYTGRNSGKPLITPASYYIEHERIHAFSAAISGWWKNVHFPIADVSP